MSSFEIGKKIELLRKKADKNKEGVPEKMVYPNKKRESVIEVLLSSELGQFTQKELLQKISEGLFHNSTPVRITDTVNQYLKRGAMVSLFIFLACKQEFSHVALSLIGTEEFTLRDYEEELKLLLLCGQPKILTLLKSTLEAYCSQACLEETLVTLILSADILRIMTLNQKEIVAPELLVSVLKTPGLLINCLNILYSRVGQLCRQYQMTDDADHLKGICELEKKYINIFKLIKSNGIELSQLCNVTQLLQNAFNTYLFYLIKYLIENTGELDRAGVVFYHYSNFPVENKIVMVPIYNDRNFLRIQGLLRENLFIKRIIKKKIGKKTFRLSEQYTIPVEQTILLED